MKSYLVAFAALFSVSALAVEPPASYLCVASTNGEAQPQGNWTTVSIGGEAGQATLAAGERYAIQIVHQTLATGDEALELNHFVFTALDPSKPHAFSTVVEGEPRIVSLGFQVSGAKRHSFTCNRM